MLPFLRELGIHVVGRVYEQESRTRRCSNMPLIPLLLTFPDYLGEDVLNPLSRDVETEDAQ